MKKIITTISFISITSSILLSLFLNITAYAVKDMPDYSGPGGAGKPTPKATEESAEVSPVPIPPKIDNLSEATFPVEDYLTLDKTDQPKKYFDDKENTPIVSFILSVIDFATIIVGSIAMILFIVAGFMFMFAQGNQQQVDEAKDIVKYAVIGLIVIFLSYLITIFVQSIFIAE